MYRWTEDYPVSLLFWSQYHHQLCVCFLSGLMRRCRFRGQDFWLWFVWPLALRRSHRLSRGLFTVAAGGSVVLNTGLIWGNPPLSEGSSGPSLLSYWDVLLISSLFFIVTSFLSLRHGSILLTTLEEFTDMKEKPTHTHTQDETCLLTCSWFPPYFWHE